MKSACMNVDEEADFTMHLGRSGEAFFVGDDDVVGGCPLHCYHNRASLSMKCCETLHCIN